MHLLRSEPITTSCSGEGDGIADLISNNESFFEIELIALLFAYEIARSDGEIDEKELNLILK